jgi:hypothetical protein
MANMSNLPTPQSLLDAYPWERELADELDNVNQRTLERGRKNGKYRYFIWGGKVRINRADVMEDMKSRIQRRNAPRRARRQSRPQNQIAV